MSTELDIKHIVSIIRRKIWLVVLIVILGTTAAGVYSTVIMKPVYQAYTKLIVNSTVGKAGMFQLDLNMINTNLSLINTYKEIIRTPSIMDLVIEQNPKLDVTTDQLMKNIRFSSVNGTQVVTISYLDTNYERATQIVNSVSQVFQQQIPKIMMVDNVYLLHMADDAEVPAPVKPEPKLNMAIGGILSLLIGIGLVLLLDYFDDTIRTEEDVTRHLGLSTLVSVPHIKNGDLKPRDTNPRPIPQEGGERTRVKIS
ncbi:YveK family protein [Paenibacillus sp. GCM10023252]|uniref:YveK family protein n=1 Tax=Paenibacillus sp. GCM10023252 TaxID=3252649 RepID=UPI0036149B2C